MNNSILQLLFYIFVVLFLYASGACSPLLLEPNGYVRDPFPVCFPSHLFSPSKPTGISLDTSGGVVSSLPHDLTPWYGVLRRLDAESVAYGSGRSGNKPNLTIVFLGGSMLSGHMTRDFINITVCCKFHLGKSPGCYRWGEDMLCPQCAYPARFGDWLAAAYPHVTVNVHNFGIGASVSKGALNSLVPKLDALGKTIDVFFLHYVNNDARGALDEVLHKHTVHVFNGVYVCMYVCICIHRRAVFPWVTKISFATCSRSVPRSSTCQCMYVCMHNYLKFVEINSISIALT